MKHDHVVVFGGNRFLGSHVADTLSDEGFRVRILIAKNPSSFDLTRKGF